MRVGCVLTLPRLIISAETVLSGRRYGSVALHACRRCRRPAAFENSLAVCCTCPAGVRSRCGAVLSHLLEIFLDIGLQRERNLVPADSGPGIRVICVLVHVRGGQLLISGNRFDGDLTGEVLGTFAEDDADFAHGIELFGEPGIFVAVVLAGAVAGLFARLFVRGLPGSTRLAILTLLRFLSLLFAAVACLASIL